jgi:hypothetical protein
MCLHNFRSNKLPFQLHSFSLYFLINHINLRLIYQNFNILNMKKFGLVALGVGALILASKSICYVP